MELCAKITDGENYKCSNKYHNLSIDAIKIKPIA
jgi:hypothetical protein